MMSTQCESPNEAVPKENLFSNPNVEVSGKATGTATEDNARTIEENMVSLSTKE